MEGQNHNISGGLGLNVLAISDCVLVTSGYGVLGEIIRRTVLKIAARLVVLVLVCILPHTELLRAEEVFISSSEGGETPLVKADATIFFKSRQWGASASDSANFFAVVGKL